VSPHELSTLPTECCGSGVASSGRKATLLSAAQLAALVRATSRELAWGLPAARREIKTWRARAESIESDTIRDDAIRTIATKRGHIDGAALFATLPDDRNDSLLRLLVAYELIWDFLDTVNERGTEAGAGQDNGRQLHLALIDAIDPSRPIADYYRYHPWKGDSGYLRGLVETCRANARRLPAYPLLLPHLLREAHRAQVLAINHDPRHEVRDSTLGAWSQAHAGRHAGVSWFELTGAASASLTIHALFALAAQPACSEADIADTRAAYFPWISAATTMLDSYVDQSEDAINGDHSYIAHYPSHQVAVARIRELIQRSLSDALALPRGERHAVIVACMAAMYLSKDSARTGEMRASTSRLVSSGGSLTRFLLPILRTWRTANAQRGT
jgi:tetraprenyl-beta-curcumene synthase